MTDIIAGIGGYALPFLNIVVSFLIILTLVVFVHEMGHYLVARWCGVRVEVFSIGFGRELFGWDGRGGTRWKFSVVPLGGYVKMFGDRNVASMPDGKAIELTAEEKRVAFPHKRLGRRAAIVAAGPIANFVFGILVYAGLFMTIGQPATAPVIGEVEPDSAAAAAGIEPGDRVLSANGYTISRFEEIRQVVSVGLGSPSRSSSFATVSRSRSRHVRASSSRRTSSATPTRSASSACAASASNTSAAIRRALSGTAPARPGTRFT